MEITISLGRRMGAGRSSDVAKGESFTVDIPEKNILANVVPRAVKKINVELATNQALDNPIGSRRLEEIAKPNSRVAICVVSMGVSGHPRGTPMEIFVPTILDRLEKAGVKDENIQIVTGNGVHRGTKLPPKDALQKNFTKRVTDDIEIISHCGRPEVEAEGSKGGALTLMGVTSRGVPFFLNSEVAKCDVKIAVGQIDFNGTKGYRGGVTMIIPGVAGWDTINANHRLSQASMNLMGNLNAPARLDAEEAARICGLNFALNSVPHPGGGYVSVTAGDPIKQHREGVKALRYLREIPIEQEADIVISRGLRSAVTNDFATKKGGTMLLVASYPTKFRREHPATCQGCRFWKACEKEQHQEKSGWSDEKLLKSIYRAGGSGVGTPGWCSRVVRGLNRVVAKDNVVQVSTNGDPEVWEGSGIGYEYSLEEALDKAFKRHGDDAKVVINNGCWAVPLSVRAPV